MILPKEIIKKIFSFFEDKKYKCDLCNISNDYVGIYSFKGPDKYYVCKRCWIGY
jgi:hypothetical protein